MAKIFWISDVSSAWNTGASWGGGVKPGAGDDAVFTGAHVGNVTVPAAPETVGNVYVQPGYTGRMGTAGSRLTVSATALVYQGSGDDAYFEGSYDSAIVETSRRDAAAFNFKPTFSGTERMRVLSGRCNILSGSTVKHLIVGHSQNGGEPFVDLAEAVEFLTVQAGEVQGTAISIGSDLNIYGGRVTLADLTAQIGRLNMGRGILTITGSTATTFNRSYLADGALVDTTQLKAALTVAEMIVGRGAVANLASGIPCVGTSWVDVLPGGKLYQTGLGLTVTYL